MIAELRLYKNRIFFYVLRILCSCSFVCICWYTHVYDFPCDFLLNLVCLSLHVGFMFFQTSVHEKIYKYCRYQLYIVINNIDNEQHSPIIALVIFTIPYMIVYHHLKLCLNCCLLYISRQHPKHLKSISCVICSTVPLFLKPFLPLL